ncbi:MAG: hypothetical protein SGJ27_31575 [Candidatus Melainabacteria bacterium]|nr:hypothetical protein [Candidatus Melainabacteria bacterium]
MEKVKNITALFSKTCFTGTAIQLVLAALFISVSVQWPAINALLIDPNVDIELRALIPAAIHRYAVSICLGSIAMSLFYFFDSKRNPRMTLKDVCCAIILSFVFYVMLFFQTLQFPVCVDDAYIDFRYVYKWVNGLGFDYNAGERVFGFTSILHLLLLTVVAFVFEKNDIAMVSQTVNTVLQASTYMLLYITTRRLFGSNLMAVFSACIFALNPQNLAHTISGKEAPLMIFLITVSIFAASSQRCGLFAWSGALLALTRPEGLIWFFASIFQHVLVKGKERLSILIAPIMVVAILYLSIFMYFGTIVPHGALGRAAMFSSMLTPYDKASFYILKFVGEDTFTQIIARLLSPDLTMQTAWAVQGCLVFLLLVELARRLSWLRFYASTVILLLLFFSYFNPYMFSWYYAWFALIAPLLVPIIFVALIGQLQSLKRYPSMLIAASIALLCAFNASFANLPPARIVSLNKHGFVTTFWPIISTLRSYPFGWNEGQDRLSMYKRACEYLKKCGTGGGQVATWEPGLVGFVLAKERILDLGGLLSDQALKYYPVPNGERTRLPVQGSIPPRSVLELKPEWCLFFDCLADNGLMSDPQFLSDYEMERFWQGSIMGGKGLFLFHRIDDGGRK